MVPFTEGPVTTTGLLCSRLQYWPTASSLTVFILFTMTLKFLSLKEGVYFSTPWLWLQPCDLLWPMEWDGSNSVKVLSLCLKRTLTFLLTLLCFCQHHENISPGPASWSKADEGHGPESPDKPRLDQHTPSWPTDRREIIDDYRCMPWHFGTVCYTAVVVTYPPTMIFWESGAGTLTPSWHQSSRPVCPGFSHQITGRHHLGQW